MKLTKLYIHNYKSFYDTTIEFDKLNIIVGENNSGKSNLIDVLEFIDIAIDKDIERAIDEKGGYDRIKNYSAVGEEKVIIRVTFSNVKGFIVFDEDINISCLNTITISFSFSKEYSILSFFVDTYIISNKDKKGTVTITFEKNGCLQGGYNFRYILSYKSYFGIERNKEKLIFCTKNKKVDKKILKDIISLYRANYIRKISTYYFDTQKIKTLSNQDSKHIELLKDGSNLGKVLYEIKEKDKNMFEAISNSLITTVNEINGIEVYKVAGNYIIAFKERGKEPIPIHIVSDGTINFLATMTALNKLYNDSILAFEEPERHLHFKVVSYLLDSFRNGDKQIIITTHSIEMLKYANLDEVIFIYRDRDGDTQTIRADKIPNLKEKMEYMKYERCMTLDEMLDEDMVWDFEQ